MSGYARFVTWLGDENMRGECRFCDNYQDRRVLLQNSDSMLTGQVWYRIEAQQRKQYWGLGASKSMENCELRDCICKLCPLNDKQCSDNFGEFVCVLKMFLATPEKGLP